MKKSILILVTFISFFSCKEQTKKEIVSEKSNIEKNSNHENNNEITIKYSTPIKGYNVSARWLIKGKLAVQGSENFVGQAILTFSNIKSKEIFYIVHPEFTIDIDKENLKYITIENEEFVKNESFTQISKYTFPKFEKVGTSKEFEGFGYSYIPFFFQDVDFDNKDELILTYAKTYEKGGSLNKIFKRYEYLNSDFSEMTEEPFTSFSGFYYGNPGSDSYSYTTIDYKNKTITHSGMSGANGAGEIIYQFKKIDDRYTLSKKTNVNNYQDWEVKETTIHDYNDYGEVIKVYSTKIRNS